MNRLVALLTVAAISFAPATAQASPSAMSPSMVGMGPHGYDFLIGKWSCINSIPSRMGGPSETTVTIARSPSGSLSVHVAGTNFESLGYVVYANKTKTWWNPTTLATGDYSTESTTQTGMKTVWTGTFYDAAMGSTMPIRDTYTITGLTKFTDLSQAKTGGAWKAQANTTCTKM